MPLAVGFLLLHIVVLRVGKNGVWSLLGVLYLFLAVRRTRPALTFWAVTLAMALRVLASGAVLATDLAFLVARYSLAAFERRRGPRLAGLVVAVIGAVRFTGFTIASRAPSELVFVFVCWAGPVGVDPRRPQAEPSPTPGRPAGAGRAHRA